MARTAVYTMPLSTTTASTASFTLTSPEVTDGGQLSVEYACDGASSTLALNWSGAPAGTKSYAVTMHHIDLDPVHIIKPKGTLT